MCKNPTFTELLDPNFKRVTLFLTFVGKINKKKREREMRSAGVDMEIKGED